MRPTDRLTDAVTYRVACTRLMAIGLVLLCVSGTLISAVISLLSTTRLHIFINSFLQKPNQVPWPGGFNGYVEHSTFMLFVRMPQVLSSVQPAPEAWLLMFYLLATVLGLHSLCIYAETVS